MTQRSSARHRRLRQHDRSDHLLLNGIASSTRSFPCSLANRVSPSAAGASYRSYMLSRQDGRCQGPSRDEADRTSKRRRVEGFPRTGIKRPLREPSQNDHLPVLSAPSKAYSIRPNVFSLYNLLSVACLRYQLQAQARACFSLQEALARFPSSPSSCRYCPSGFHQDSRPIGLRGSRRRAVRKGSSSSSSFSRHLPFPSLPLFPSFLSVTHHRPLVDSLLLLVLLCRLRDAFFSSHCHGPISRGEHSFPRSLLSLLLSLFSLRRVLLLTRSRSLLSLSSSADERPSLLLVPPAPAPRGGDTPTPPSTRPSTSSLRSPLSPLSPLSASRPLRARRLPSFRVVRALVRVRVRHRALPLV
jgi:hypothetical protein